MREFKNSPLPFQGQKRKFVREFKEALNGYPSDGIYIDLFGGSGLLSHTVKQKYPNAKVVYNDFDNFRNRLENVQQTNNLLVDIRKVLVGLNKAEKLTKTRKDVVLSRIAQEKGFVDYITLSSNLLFSAKYVTNFEDLKKQTLYNNVRKSNYEIGNYLNGVEVVCFDYKELFAKYQSNDKVIYLVDPPYLSTDVSTYSNDKFWKLKDYLDVSSTLLNGKYFYFTSNRSHIIELMDWVADNTGGTSPFDGAIRKNVNQQLNYNARYTDIMLYKGWTSNITR